ncbi:AAA family ATPase [Latilactobacillus graminis]|uniref:Protein CR006 P-loop domain-containing protein n=2 Tax=Latilactobacillus graminis TaxID=60519 RepID=A0AA89L4U7_9LACO|nr:AAA family ATPase [Latilactobacillus graminis]KRM22462.1 hypothetical protein FC90_GL001065 [Latilactobacillus graminis DSM 20719]QFP79371.1 AAA family ATPase [Latilactobacillus graminis]
MINRIEDVNSKSFKHFSYDETLSKVNIFFGTNGSGKTALSNWLLDQEPLHRIFNTDYVRENILAQDEINGVKLTVGNEVINIEENIERISSANVNISQQTESLNIKLREEKNEVFQILNTTLDKARKQFKLNTNIKQKQKAKTDPIKALTLWYSDIKEFDIKENSSEELEREKKLLESESRDLDFQVNVNRERFTKLVKALEEPTMIPSIGVSNEVAIWIKEGLHIHNMNENTLKCEFCGNNFDTQRVSKLINEKTNTTHAKLISSLENFKNDLVQLCNSIQALPTLEQNEELLKKINQLIEIITNKIQNTMNTFTVESTLFSEIIKFNNNIENKRELINKEIRIINQKIDRIEQIAKSWVGQQLKENQQIKAFVKNIKEIEEAVLKNSTVLKENEQWMSDQKVVNSDLKPFQDLVNQQFVILGIDFRLEIAADNQHYIIRHKSSEFSIRNKDLSEGERRLLGFLHFYYDLFERPEESLMKQVSLVIIDDPITSLDNDNRYYLTELINKFIKKIKQLHCQLFLFTHSSLDFHNIGYGSDNQLTAFYKIRKNEFGESTIKKVDRFERQNYSDYYQSNFKGIFEFAKLSNTKIGEDNFLSYGNKARLVFESHARTHYKLEYATRASIDSLMEFYEVGDKFKDQFMNMLDVVNSLSHGPTFADYNAISSKEVQNAVRFMLAVLYKKDKYHVEQMAGDLIVKSNRRNIMAWLDILDESY